MGNLILLLIVDDLMNKKLINPKDCRLAYKSSQNHINKPSAFYVAGRAAAIHFGNLRKGLPPIYFQVCIETLEPYVLSTRKPKKTFLLLVRQS
jgi:hypothetical protein